MRRQCSWSGGLFLQHSCTVFKLEGHFFVVLRQVFNKCILFKVQSQYANPVNYQLIYMHSACEGCMILGASTAMASPSIQANSSEFHWTAVTISENYAGCRRWSYVVCRIQASAQLCLLPIYRSPSLHPSRCHNPRVTCLNAPGRPGAAANATNLTLPLKAMSAPGVVHVTLHHVFFTGFGIKWAPGLPWRRALESTEPTTTWEQSFGLFKYSSTTCIESSLRERQNEQRASRELPGP